MKDYLINCTLCPRECNINRYKTLGYCQSNANIKIANYSLHKWEEPPISGNIGSGTIFFTYCCLKCIYCQNYSISINHNGYIVSEEKLASIMLKLQEKGAHNINLVTMTHYTPLIINSLKIAKEKGLSIPIICNTSGYEKVSTLKLLQGYIDIYLPDLKYTSPELSIKYSHCKDYFKIATSAIKEMYNQVGECEFNSEGIMTKGLIVRHLVLPGHIEDSKKILKYLYDTYKDNIYISIMNQYTPVNKTKYNNLNRKLTDREYNEVIEYAYDIGIRKAFVQDKDTCKESFIPNFSCKEEEKI